MGHEWPVALGRRPLVRVSLLQFTPRAVVDLPLGWLSYTEAMGNDRTQTGVRTRATCPPQICSSLFPGPKATRRVPVRASSCPRVVSKSLTSASLTHEKNIWTWDLLSSPSVGWNDQGQCTLGNYVLKTAKRRAA